MFCAPFKGARTSEPSSAFRTDTRAVGNELGDQPLAHAVRDVRSGPCGASDDITAMLPARIGIGIRPSGSPSMQDRPTLIALWVNVPRRCCARQHPGAAVLGRGVAQGHPAGQVLLRVDEGVAVVLVPGEGRRVPGFL